jgi:hypothetical protein
LTLSDTEGALLQQITFEGDVRQHDPEGFARNGDAVAQLISALLDRNAIPEQRLKYFNDPVKGSRRDLFVRNHNTDEDILRSFSFLTHARYFVCGPDLPTAAMAEFRDAVRRCGHVGPSDAIELADLARRQVRTLGLPPHEVGEEYFKLALDCGMWVSHALHVEDRVKKLR